MEVISLLLSGGIRMIWMFSIAMAIAAYVLQGLGLYTIAKRRGLNRPWLAWVPVANDWILGAVADHYRKTVHKKKTNKRMILLGLNIAELVLAVLCMILFIIAVTNLFSMPEANTPEMYNAAIEEFEYNFYQEAAMIFGVIIAGFGLMLLCLLPVLILTVILGVFRWMAIWDVFHSCDPRNAQVYFLVSFLLGIFKISGLESIFMVACMNKDEGMVVPTSEATASFIPEEPTEM